MAKKETLQLHPILSSLRHYVEDSNERGSLIGYGVMQALIPFTSSSGSIEERHFQEIKSIYETLNSALSRCKHETGYLVLAGIKKEIDSDLGSLINIVNGELHEKQELAQTDDAPLLTIITASLASSSRSYQDRLRRNGSSLYEDISQRGFIKGRKNSLLADYDAVRQYFGSERK